MTECECPIDRVACLRSDCPRADAIKAALRARFDRGRKMAGDPAKGVTAYGETLGCKEG